MAARRARPAPARGLATPLSVSVGEEVSVSVPVVVSVSVSVAVPVSLVSVSDVEGVGEPEGVPGVVMVVVTVAVEEGVVVGSGTMIPMTVVLAGGVGFTELGPVTRAAQASWAASWAAAISLVSQASVKHSRAVEVISWMFSQAQAKSVTLSQPTSGRTWTRQLSYDRKS